jgi:thymidylate kinase
MQTKKYVEPAYGDTSISGLLNKIFTKLNDRKILYAVLRNYEGLPDNPGRDIDIITADFAGFRQVLERVAVESGYHMRTFQRYSDHDKFHLIKILPLGFNLLEIDVGWSIRWKGIPTVGSNLLKNNLVRKKCFYTLPPGAEAAISLIKDLIYHGKVLQKYKALIQENSNTDRESFIQTLTPCFSSSLAIRLWEKAVGGDWPGLESQVPELRRAAVLRSLERNLPGQIGRWVAFLWWHLVKFVHPSGLFLVLIGPDGSGKSTIAQGLRHYFQPLFQASRYFHSNFKILPRLRDLARRLGFQKAGGFDPGKTDTSSSPEELQFGRLRSLVYLIYYSLDYLLGYPVIIRARGRGELVIFDRYFYDYMIQPGMSLPRRLINMVLQWLPKPDAVVYLKNNPDVILSRKTELSREELERQGQMCNQVISSLSQGYLIETSGTPEETTDKVAKVLLRKILNSDNYSASTSFKMWQR